MQALQVQNLTKHYGAVKAVDGVSFSVGAGEVVGLLGPNGAGKTTTIQMLLGLLEPSGGEILVMGKSFSRNRREILQEMNFSATYASLPGNLTVKENLNIFARLYGVIEPWTRVLEVIKIFDLEKFAKVRVGRLSSGEQSRVNLAKAFLNRPKVLLLDEPTASLDPDAAERMRSIIKKQAKEAGSSILWTSHNMFEVETVCDKIIFLSRGRILDSGTPLELVKKYGRKNLEETFIALAREPLENRHEK